MTRPKYLLVAICMLPVVAWGCGSPAQVGLTGTVTLDGVPLPEGRLLFEPVDATTGQRRDVMIREGAFALPDSEGLPPGQEFRVIIKAFKKTGRRYPNADKSVPYDEVVQYIPAQYNSESTLRVTISAKRDENQLEFDLVSPSP